MSGGLGTGKSVEELTNPETNAEIALNYIRNAVEGGSLWDAFSPWVNARNQILGQGGETQMTDGQTQTMNEWVQRILQQVQALLDEGGAINIDAAGRLLQTIPSDIRGQLFGGVGAEGLEAPSPQAVAVSQADLDIALAQAQTDIERLGIETAAQNFVNRISEAQERRATAEFAQEYARGVAPPGVTTLPGFGPESGRAQLFERVGWQPPAALPLPPGPAAGPFQALGQAQQYVPQAPNLQFTPPTLPGPVDLSQYSGFPQVQGFNPAGLPMGMGGDASNQAAMLAEAMRRAIGPDVGLFGPMSFSGAQLPIGGR